MHSVCIENFDDLKPYAVCWDALAGGNAFRSWRWLSTWWRHYGDQRRRELRLLVAWEPDQLRGVLPCYVESSLARGRVWRLLGDGEVCSDHLGLLAASNSVGQSAAELAEHLLGRDDWDALDFAAVDESDVATRSLALEMRERGCSMTETPGGNVWSVDLPADWETYLMQMSKSHRKQLRRLQRQAFDAGRAKRHSAESPDEFVAAWNVFEELHQRRWRHFGQAGCFASTRWANFHREVAAGLLLDGRLRLSWIEHEGTPLAAEYQFTGGDATFAYQGGLDPARLDLEPGRMSLMCSIQSAISDGCRRLDLLRGDEPYKRHWRAQPTSTLRIEAAPPRLLARCRHWAYSTAYDAGRAAKRIAGMLG